MNKYLFVIDTDGNRITSLLDGLHGNGEKELTARAKKEFPDAQYVYNDEDMQQEFLSGKIYIGGKFIDAPVIESIPTKAEKIAYIKKYYDERFATLDKALVRRRLINADITDLQKQFKQLNIEMLAKIKEVK